MRKERRVKAGFVAAEDVARYVNPKVAERNAPSVYSQNGGPIGFVPIQTMEDIMNERKASKKKKKKNKKVEEEVEEKVEVKEVEVNNVEESLIKQAEENPDVAVEKRKKALTKKLRQIEALELECLEKGRSSLDPDQIRKIDKKTDLLHELSSLSISKE